MTMMTISSRFNSAEGKNFRRKRNININTCTFHSLSQRVSLREIFESKLEGRNFCANFPTVSQRARERQNRFFSTHSKTSRRGEGRRTKRRGKIEGLNLSQRFTGIEQREGNLTTMFLLLAWPPLFRRGENRPINEQFVEQGRSFPLHRNIPTFPRFLTRTSGSVPFCSVFQRARKEKSAANGESLYS